MSYWEKGLSSLPSFSVILAHDVFLTLSYDIKPVSLEDLFYSEGLYFCSFSSVFSTEGHRHALTSGSVFTGAKTSQAVSQCASVIIEGLIVYTYFEHQTVPDR